MIWSTSWQNRSAWTTWDREVASVNSFYTWACHSGRRYAVENPIVQRASRARDTHNRRATGTAPAESSHVGPRNEVLWLTPRMYRTWRDVGLRGYTPAGVRDEGFRGRFAARNTAYGDMMIRTGLRLAEQRTPSPQRRRRRSSLNSGGRTHNCAAPSTSTRRPSGNWHSTAKSYAVRHATWQQ